MPERAPVRAPGRDYAWAIQAEPTNAEIHALIEAESMAAALTIARANPFIKAIRVYEIREHQEP